MDEMQFEILEDGTISVKTSAISDTNHYSADELLKALAEITGGTRRTEKRKDKVAHVHVLNGQRVVHKH